MGKRPVVHFREDEYAKLKDAADAFNVRLGPFCRYLMEGRRKPLVSGVNRVLAAKLGRSKGNLSQMLAHLRADAVAAVAAAAGSAQASGLGSGRDGQAGAGQAGEVDDLIKLVIRARESLVQAEDALRNTRAAKDES